MYRYQTDAAVDGRYTAYLYEVIESGIDLFSFDYEWKGTPEHRANIEFKFTEHYRYREIGFETYGLFLRHFQRTWREVIAYYNTLWTAQANLVPENVLLEYSGKSEGMGWYADAPNTTLNAADVRDHKYATNFTDNTAGTSGRNRTEAELYREFVAAWEDIDYRFITDERFQNLFMRVF